MIIHTAKLVLTAVISRIIGCLLLSGCILITYWGIQYQGFVYFDDIAYVVENRHVQGGLSGGGFLWALQSMEVSNWHPLTWLSLMADYELYGLHAGGYHWTNVLLHLFGTVLLFLTLERMTKAMWRSFFVALFFGIHPLHVESVAWIAERKDVLSGLFWMASLWFYALYAERGTWRQYLLVLGSFVLGLLSKPMVVTLPFVLLLLDYWPLDRFNKEGKGGEQFRALILEKAPFFGLSAISCVITYIAQYRGNAITTLESLPFRVRVANAFISYGQYLWKLIWPVDLAFFYPYQLSWSGAEISGAVLSFGVITALVVRYRRGYPYLLTGWLWYVGTLIPVIGLIQAGMQAMADRYTYLPLTGLFIIIVWGMGELGLGLRHRWRVYITGIISTVIVALLMICSHVQVGCWKDSMSLFAHAVAVTKDNYLAQNNFGAALFERKEIDTALAHFSEALRIKPRYAGAYNNLGLALSSQGKIPEAITNFKQALRIKPDNVEALNNLGLALESQNKIPEAISYYNATLKIRPDYVAALNNLARVLAGQGRLDEAITNYEKALNVKPGDAELNYNLGLALANKGRLHDAVVYFLQALYLKPDYGEAQNNLGTALARLGKMDPATICFREALRIDPTNATAHNNLGLVLAGRGQWNSARDHFREALRLKPDYDEARKNMVTAARHEGRD